MIHHSEASADSSAPDAKQMRAVLGPQAVSRGIEQAISMCWMLLPPERRTAENVATEIRRVVERALANLKEDERAFGGGSRPPDPAK